MTEVRWQLWCYYETADEWKLEGFFRSLDEARRYFTTLREDVNTPCMPDWEYIKVEVSVP